MMSDVGPYLSYWRHWTSIDLYELPLAIHPHLLAEEG